MRRRMDLSYKYKIIIESGGGRRLVGRKSIEAAQLGIIEVMKERSKRKIKKSLPCNMER
jgi:hypothetical protein